jgi:hypothetical protein
VESEAEDHARDGRRKADVNWHPSGNVGPVCPVLDLSPTSAPPAFSAHYHRLCPAPPMIFAPRLIHRVLPHLAPPLACFALSLPSVLLLQYSTATLRPQRPFRLSSDGTSLILRLRTGLSQADKGPRRGPFAWFPPSFFSSNTSVHTPSSPIFLCHLSLRSWSSGTIPRSVFHKLEAAPGMSGVWTYLLPQLYTLKPSFALLTSRRLPSVSTFLLRCVCFWARLKHYTLEPEHGVDATPQLVLCPHISFRFNQSSVALPCATIHKPMCARYRTALWPMQWHNALA